MKKKRIFPHRSYRKIYIPKIKLMIDSLVLLTITIIAFLNYQTLIKYMVLISKEILSTVFKDISISKEKFLIFKILYIEGFGLYPNKTLCIISFIISLFSVLFLSKEYRARNITLIFIYINITILISSLFFIIVPEKFPYDLTTFSKLYIKTTLIMWIMLFIITNLSILPLPNSIFSKVAFVSFLFIYSIIFSAVRYMFFIIILKKFSYLFSAVIFFFLGPLLDFIYIVGFFSWYLSETAKHYRKKIDIWKWT